MRLYCSTVRYHHMIGHPIAIWHGLSAFGVAHNQQHVRQLDTGLGRPLSRLLQRRSPKDEKNFRRRRLDRRVSSACNRTIRMEHAWPGLAVRCRQVRPRVYALAHCPSGVLRCAGCAWRSWSWSCRTRNSAQDVAPQRRFLPGAAPEHGPARPFRPYRWTASGCLQVSGTVEPQISVGVLNCLIAFCPGPCPAPPSLSSPSLFTGLHARAVNRDASSGSVRVQSAMSHRGGNVLTWSPSSKFQSDLSIVNEESSAAEDSSVSKQLHAKTPGSAGS